MDELLTTYLPLLIALAAFLDVAAGYLPDKWVPYVGFVRRLVRALLDATQKGPMTPMIAILVISTLAAGCALTGTMNSTQKLAVAKLVAKKAGKYVARNNLEIAHQIVANYNTIKSIDDDDGFRGILLDYLHDYLEAEGVKGSDELRSDAEDLLDILGFDINAIPLDENGEISITFLQLFEIDVMKEVIEAFIDGMGYGVA